MDPRRPPRRSTGSYPRPVTVKLLARRSHGAAPSDDAVAASCWVRCLALALFAALAAPLGLLGCGSEGPVQVPVRVRVFEVATERTPAARGLERVGGFELTNSNGDACPWKSTSSHGSLFSEMRTFGRYGRRDSTRPVFVARGEGGFTIEHAVPFDWTRDNVATALVTLWGSGEERVRSVVLGQDGVALRHGPWLSVKRRQEPQELRLAVPPRESGDDAVAQGLGLEFEGRGSHAALMALDIYRADLATGLPGLGQQRLVMLQGDGRESCGLVEGSPWDASFQCTERSRLRLSVAWPPIARRSEFPPALAVRCVGDGGEIMDEIIRLDEARAGEWLDREFSLGILGAGPARLEFEIRGSGAVGDEALLLGDVVIVSPSVEPPATVLMVTSDTHRADYFGPGSQARSPAGSLGERAMTPVIDALGDRGLAFRAAYAAANVTNPSHVALMTGLHPRDTQIVDNLTTLSGSAETLSEAYRRAGYRTLSVISTQHLGPDQSGLGQGFDRFDAPKGSKRNAAYAVDVARRWLAESTGEPLFLWVHLFDAHAPYASKDADPSKLYSGDPTRVPEGRKGWPAEPSPWIVQAGIQDPAYVEALYRGQVEYLDDTLHGLLSEPRVRSGWTAFTADHGESFGALDLWWNHIGLYHPTVAVPLVLAGPGVPVGISDRPVGNVNLARTLLDLTGVASGIPGQSLVELGRTSSGGEPQFAISAHGLQAAIFNGPWCLTLDLRSYLLPAGEHAWVKGQVRLLDRRRGLDTADNLVDEEPELARKMRARLLLWLSQAEPVTFGSAATLDAAAAENLDALGYGGFTAKDEAAWWTEEGVDPAWMERFK